MPSSSVVLSDIHVSTPASTARFINGPLVVSFATFSIRRFATVMAGRLFHFSIAILALVIRLSYAVQGDEEDYVPDFFGGRRDDGIAPPPPPATTRSLADVETKFFTQKLDHTRSSNTATWQQVSSQWWTLDHIIQLGQNPFFSDTWSTSDTTNPVAQYLC